VGDDADWGEWFAKESTTDAIEDAIEELMVDALEAEDADLGALIGGLSSIGRLAGGIGRVAGAAGRAGRVVGRVGGLTRRAQSVAGRVGGLTRQAQRVAGRVGRVTRQARRLDRRINRLSRQGRRIFGTGDAPPDLPDDPQREDDRTNQQARQVPEPYAFLLQRFRTISKPGL
jgi:hypothetical protein